MSRNSSGHTGLQQTLAACRGSFLAVGIFSLFINLLMLTPSFYMLQVYDRVVSSGSKSTLVMLSLIMLLMFATLGGLEWVRSQILVRVAARLEVGLDERLFDLSFRQALYSGGTRDNGQPLADLAGLRQFLAGQGLFAFFDAPWLPIYLGVMFLFHPLFGMVGLVSAGILLCLALCNAHLTRENTVEASRLAIDNTATLGHALRNAEAVESMGMLADLRGRWRQRHHAVLALQGRTAATAGMLSAISRVFRLTVQSLVLGLGAWLVIRQQITPGMMIAGSILLGRALAPVDLAIAGWRQFGLARVQYRRLQELLRGAPPPPQQMSLPPPEGRVTAEQASFAPPGSTRLVLEDVSFTVDPGEIVGVIGPSASGKTTLARGVLGIWPAARGKIRLDGGDIFGRNREELGPYLGYLPQDIELFEGTVGENIARFGEVDAPRVVEAAKRAGVHEMILHLPQGYDTPVGAMGRALSAGQRQRIGLARALFGDPRLVVLDEPNSNLDDRGELALLRALKDLKARHCTALVISHRKTILGAVDKLMLLQGGKLARYGSRDDVLRSLERRVARLHPGDSA